MRTLFDPVVNPDNFEEVARDEVLSRFETTRAGILAWLRERMKTLYFKKLAEYGADAFVTADDARIILEAEPDVPPPEELNRNFMGSLFKNGEWETAGQFIKSKTPRSHANLLRCWRWVGKRAK